jgi:hypothetical protein
VVTHPELGPWLLKRTPTGGLGEPDAIAALLVFLASPPSSL